MKRIMIGTRTSRLARAQTEIVTEMLRKKFPALEIEVVPVTTMGDRLPDEKRAEVEGKGAFTEDLETLQAGGATAIVCLLTDTELEWAGVANFRSAAISQGLTWRRLAIPDQGVPATGAGQRQQTRRRHPLRQLREFLLATDERCKRDRQVAGRGLRRLHEEGRITEYFSIEELVPAPCQGTIAVEIRADDHDVGAALMAIDDGDVRAVSTCERSFATRLGGDCDLPAGFCAAKEGERMRLVGAILSPDGKTVVKQTSFEDAARPYEVGRRFAEKMLELGGEAILEGVMR